MKILAILSTVALCALCCDTATAQSSSPNNAAAALVKAAQGTPAKTSDSASTTAPASASGTAHTSAAPVASAAAFASSPKQQHPLAPKRPAVHAASPLTKQPATPIFEKTVPAPAPPSRSGLPFSPNSMNDRGIKAFAMPLDSKLVVFPYDPNYTYPLYCRVGMFTRIKLAPDEKVKGFYLSNQVTWIHHVTKDRNSVLVMAMAEGTNTASLVTTKRDYEISFTTVPEPENWYQRVSWHFPLSNFEEDVDSLENKSPLEDVDSFSEVKTTRSDRTAPATGADRTPPGADDPEMVNLDKVNFNYTIEGDAPFKPSMVFDDGRSTWFKMPRNQDAPAFFALSKDGDGIPLTPVPKGQFVVVGQVLPYGALLKIGKDEVRIKNKGADCGFFGRGCWNGAGARNIRD